MLIYWLKCCHCIVSFTVFPVLSKNFDVILQTNFATKCVQGQIKAFSLLFCTASDSKCVKGGKC